MNRDRIMIAIALAGLGFLIWGIAANTYWGDSQVPLPLQGEAATNPFYSRQRLVEALGAQADKRDVLGDLPSSDAVMVLASWHWDVIESRRERLEHWVESGGRLVVDSTLVDTNGALEDWSGIAIQHQPPADEDEESGEAEEPEVPEALEQLLGSKLGPCTTLEVQPAAEDRASYRVCNLARRQWLETERPTEWLLQAEDGRLQAIRVSVGRGSVTLLNATPFANRDFLEADHALLFVALTQLRRGDEVIFLSEEERPTLLSLMWNHGAPAIVVALLLLAAALWRGGVRFGPLTARPEMARRSIAEQIRGTGQFTLRFGGGRALHAAMIRALEETAQRHIPGYASLPESERVAAIARCAGVDAGPLAEIITYTGSRRAGELRNSVTTLEYTRRRLLDVSHSNRSRGSANAD